MKNEKLNTWLWKWHFIAGIISLPFIIILSITGTLYLFKNDYEAPRQKHIKEVAITGTPITFQKQWEIANQSASKKPNAMMLPIIKNQATEFVSGQFGGKSSIYINPYQAKVTGKIIPRNSLMFKIRKLHGELLLGKFGTKIVELIASWMVVLIITGLYIWWPGRGWSLKGFFIPRIRQGKRILFRDLHAITGFWISIFLILVLAGGFPWTDVVGSNFKWLQKVTNTGYPSTWNGHQLQSETKENPLSLDTITTIVKNLNLKGEVTIKFPKNKTGVYSISNTTPDLDQQKIYHIDQYTGKQLLQHNWEDVGILMRGRMWVMAFHQGEFGYWNWLLMLGIGISLTIMSISAIVSYLLRKRKGDWGIPKVPNHFNIGTGILIILILLSIIFPLFGISMLMLWGYETILSRFFTFTKN